jgi:hypothetical protein
MRRFTLLCLLALAACTTSKEITRTRTYSGDLGSVTAAAMGAIADVDLAYAGQQHVGDGLILITQRKELADFGGNVMLYIQPSDEGVTVRVDAARVVSVDGHAARDVAPQILTRIGQRLGQ